MQVISFDAGISKSPMENNVWNQGKEVACGFETDKGLKGGDRKASTGIHLIEEIKDSDSQL